MMNSVQNWTDRIHTLLNDKSFQVEVDQIKAKALLGEIAPEIPTTHKWSYVPSRIVRNITAAGLGLQIVSSTGLDNLKELEGAAQQVARAWESLGKLGERTSRDTALMNSAVAYEMAGYQANAACLARQVCKDFHDIDKPSVAVLTSAFLQRLFLRVRLLSNKALKEPAVLTVLDDAVVAAAASALAAQGFTTASQYFLSGRGEAIAEAGQSLEQSEQFFASLGAVEESNLVRSVRSLLPIMQKKSTWHVLSGLVPNNTRWERYLKLLARGTGASILRSSSVSELWPSQMEALENGLFTSSSKVIRMPTSAGKTRIAELAIVYTLVTQPGAKCVYVAPYRALVSELEQAFLNLFGDLGFRVSSIIGTYESDDFEQVLVADADILVMTPEKLDLLQRLKPDFLDKVRLMIMDEGQIVHEQQRGVKFEILLTRLRRRLRKARLLFISAVVPQETLDDFARWFGANLSTDVLVSNWRPSIQRYAKFEWRAESGVIRYSPDEDIPIHEEFGESVSGVLRQRTYEYVNPETGRINRRHFPEVTSKAQTAAELAFKFAELGPVLVFCSQTNFVEAVAKSLLRRLDLSRLTNEDIPHYFVANSQSRSMLSTAELLGEDHLATKVLKHNIAIHHGDLPEAVRKPVEMDFRDGRIRILVATNTLAQGVNLPIRTVVVHSCWRYMPDGHIRIAARDYWNIAGRAGRAGAETEGTIVHIVMSDSDDQDYEYYLKCRQNVEPVESALLQLLRGLACEAISEETVREKLDPEVLALLVEEGPHLLSEESIAEVLSETLVKVQATRHGLDMKPLQRAFLTTATEIAQKVASDADRSTFSSTGLSTKSCKVLESYIVSNRDAIESLLKHAGPQDVETLATFALEACLMLPEMQPSREFGGSYSELLQRWLSGANIRDLLSEFGDQVTSPEDLTKLLEDLFSFRLSWGVSALIRIAINLLELDNASVSDYAKFFPSMVKFGVPNPVATWALAAGVPFRDTAMKLAAKYLTEASRHAYRDFLGWLGKIDSETLQYSYGLRSPILEDVSRALSTSCGNDLLTEHSNVNEILPHDTWVRGIGYGDRRLVAIAAQVGERVAFIRDHDNPVDRNAVKVVLNGQTLGYLERQLAQLMAPDVDSGLSLSGVIIAVERQEVPQIEVRIQVASSD